MWKKYKHDFILAIIILLFCAICFVVWIVKDVYYNGDLYANVYLDGKCIQSLDLDENQKIEIDGSISKMIIEVKSNRVRVKESGCPEQICVHRGWKKRKNATITCLPNKVMIIIEKEAKIDE